MRQIVYGVSEALTDSRGNCSRRYSAIRRVARLVMAFPDQTKGSSQDVGLAHILQSKSVAGIVRFSDNAPDVWKLRGVRGLDI